MLGTELHDGREIHCYERPDGMCTILVKPFHFATFSVCVFLSKMILPPCNLQQVLQNIAWALILQFYLHP
jgi:hypothetical protein